MVIAHLLLERAMEELSMQIELASEMGFCFGVRRAIKLAEKAVQEREILESLGAIIHNKQVVHSLAIRGMCKAIPY